MIFKNPKTFKQFLNKAGFTNLTMAVNGLDGLERVKAEKPDLVISDWNMPEMDGLEFLKALRQMDEFKHLPFIMATAQSDKGQQLAAKEAGASGHIPKPFDDTQIRGAIETVFSDASADERPEHRPRKVVNGKVELKVAHIQITDHLALGALKHRIDQGDVVPEYFDLTTHLQPGWNPIQEGLENGDMDCALVLAPIAMDLFAYGSPIKLVLFAHKNDSKRKRISGPFTQ